MTTKSAKFIISGKVQGVFFRATAKKTADRLQLHGWVANRPDGSVQGVVEGDERAIDEFLSWAKEGSSAAKVDQIEIEWIAPTGKYNSFKIEHY